MESLQGNTPSAVLEQAPTQTTPECAPLNTNELLERCLGRIELAQSVISKFQQQFDRELEELGERVAEGDAESVRSIAHRLKGTTATVSAHGLMATLAELETLGSAGETEPMAESFSILSREWTRVSSFVDDCFCEFDAEHTEDS